MIMRKKYTSILVGMLILSILTACAPEDPNGEIVKPIQESNTAENNTSGKSTTTPEYNSIEELLLETPNHFEKVYSEDFAVEAEVNVPNVKTADILLAKYRSFDEEKLVSIFYSTEIPQRNVSEVDDIVSYNDNKSNLYIAKDRVDYSSHELDVVKFPTDSFTMNSDLYSTYPRFSQVYKQDNLKFMTRSDAAKNVSDILLDLSLDIIDNPEIYAIDSPTMQIQQEERIQKEIDIQNKMGVSPLQDPTFGYETKDVFTEEDDFYILNFKMRQQEIPITQKSYTIAANERGMMGSTAKVSFSQKGIIGLSLNGIYEVQGVDESPATLITMEDAIQVAFEQHNSIISTNSVNVKAVDLEYVPIPYNSNYDEVKLVPAWSLTVTYHTDTTLDKSSKNGTEEVASRESNSLIFINAVTGEVIQ